MIYKLSYRSIVPFKTGYGASFCRNMDHLEPRFSTNFSGVVGAAGAAGAGSAASAAAAVSVAALSAGPFLWNTPVWNHGFVGHFMEIPCHWDHLDPFRGCLILGGWD